MLSYIIEGGRKLEGEVNISGSKNAALPIMAASILNSGVTTLYNVPNICDIITMKEILTKLGCIVQTKKNKVIINSSNMFGTEIPQELMRKMRSSVVIAGSIIGRFKKAIFSYPRWM